MHDDSQSKVQRDKAADDENDQEVQRELDAVWRRDQQGVAVVELRRQRGDHRSDGKQKKPEQDAHNGGRPPSPTTGAGASPAGAPARGPPPPSPQLPPVPFPPFSPPLTPA